MKCMVLALVLMGVATLVWVLPGAQACHRGTPHGQHTDCGGAVPLPSGDYVGDLPLTDGSWQWPAITGDAVGGPAANSACGIQFENARICTGSELLHAYLVGDLPLPAAGTVAWWVPNRSSDHQCYTPEDPYHTPWMKDTSGGRGGDTLELQSDGTSWFEEAGGARAQCNLLRHVACCAR